MSNLSVNTAKGRNNQASGVKKALKTSAVAAGIGAASTAALNAGAQKHIINNADEYVKQFKNAAEAAKDETVKSAYKQVQSAILDLAKNGINKKAAAKSAVKAAAAIAAVAGTVSLIKNTVANKLSK